MLFGDWKTNPRRTEGPTASEDKVEGRSRNGGGHFTFVRGGGESARREGANLAGTTRRSGASALRGVDHYGLLRAVFLDTLRIVKGSDSYR